MGYEQFIDPIHLQSFRGLNTKLSDISIQTREASDLQNINLTQEIAESRNGSISFTTTQMAESSVAKAVTGIYQGTLGGTVYYVATSGTRVYSVTSAGVISNITGAATLTDSANLLFDFETFIDGSSNDVIVLVNGSNAPLKWTGSGNVATLSSVPANFKYVKVHKNRLWGSSGDYLYHSDLLDGETWPSNAVIRFKTAGFTTQDITALTTYNDAIVVGKEDGIWMVSGESINNAFAQRIVTGDGPISGYSIREVESTRYGNILIFVNRLGQLKGFNGTQNLIDLSDPITPTLQTYNRSRTKYATAVNYEEKDQYLASYTFSSGTTHNTIFGYDYFLDGVGQPESTMLKHSGIEPNYMTIMSPSGDNRVYIGTYDGWIIRYDQGAYDIASMHEIVTSTGASRSSNVVTITTAIAHGLSVGDTVVIEGVTDSSFDGSFTIASTPTTTTFTYAQTDSNATSGDGRVIETANISSYWQSKKYDLGKSSYVKQMNDFNAVFKDKGAGSVKFSVITDKGRAQETTAAPAGGSIYGKVIYGEAIYGAIATAYDRITFSDVTGLPGLIGRYFQVRVDSVSGFQFGIEELILGATYHGYQKEGIS